MNRVTNVLLVAIAVLTLFAVVSAVYSVKEAQRESGARCQQVGRLTDAVGGIVNFVNQPNPSRTPAQQAAINDFLKKSNDLLNHARPC